MNAFRFGIKFFVADSASVDLSEFVPVFHSWIQNQAVKNHLLIDVHDYSHIRQGPGILLVAHEGNFSMDSEGGRLGLVYFRKQPGPGSGEERLSSAIETALEACRRLEQEPGLKGRIRFAPGELLAIANDRLHAPNNDDSFSKFRPILESALKQTLGASKLEMTRAGKDPKERLAIHVRY